MATELNVFGGKVILLVNTGTIKKKFILQKLKKLGLTLVVLNKEKNWAQPYVDHWIMADTANHSESISSIKSFIATHQDVKIEGVLTFWEDDVLLTSKIVDRFNFIGIPYNVAKKARNKFLFREFCKENHIKTPQYKLVRSVADLDFISENFSFPVVVKPTYGSSSAYVVKAADKNELANTYNYLLKNISPEVESALSDGVEILVEEYIDGDEVDVDIVLQNGKLKFFSISDNDKTNEPFFVETGQSIPTSLPIKNQRELVELGEQILEIMGVQNGCIHFEAKSTKYGPVPIEVNLRMGGDEVYSFVKGAWGVDLIENAVKIAIGIYIDKIHKPEIPFKYITGKYFLSDCSGILVKLDIDPGLKKNINLQELNMFKEIGDAILIPPEGYDFLGWLTVSGINPIDAKDNLAEVIKAVKYEVVKFDADSSMGKTLRKSRFSPAVFNKDLVRGAAKMERVRRSSRETQRNLNLGIIGHNYDGNESNKVTTNGWDKVLVKTLKERGYKLGLYDFDSFSKAFNDLGKSEVDLVFNICESINNSPVLKHYAAAILDCLQIPYTGSSSSIIELCMDKIAVKKMLSFHNIPTPKWDYAYSLNDEINENLHYPLIVKPAKTDNSFGIINESVVINKEELQKQLKRIIVDLGYPALVEEYIEGDEYDVAILGNDESDFKVLPLSRSIFKNMPEGYWHIYTSEAKNGGNPIYDNIIIQRPLRNISKKLETLITEIALDTYTILGCKDYGRVEFRVDKYDNPYVLELNPNPSLAINDCLPVASSLVDMNYGDLLEEIIEITTKRYKKNKTNLNQ